MAKEPAKTLISRGEKHIRLQIDRNMANFCSFGPVAKMLTPVLLTSIRVSKLSAWDKVRFTKPRPVEGQDVILHGRGEVLVLEDRANEGVDTSSIQVA